MLERFTRYVKTWSESNSIKADEGVFPSSECQFDFARDLEKELKSLGLEKVQVTEDCYVYGRLPATKNGTSKPSILLLAHLDTVDEVSGKNVNPQITEKDDDIIISTDGTTLLGADDKAGITAIMTAIDFFTSDEGKNLEHGDIEVIFSPDEETGHGMDKVPLNLIQSKMAYTVDGGELGELETECFNAYSANVTFTGKSTHTGTAKADGMVNANTLAGYFLSKLPHDKAPETTEKYESFIAPMKVSSTIESADINLLLRSFNMEEIMHLQEIVSAAANEVISQFGGKVDISFTQQYLNMKDKLDQNPQVIERLEKAFKAAGVPIINKPIRGGTDGSRLTEMGIPTPNIFTGAHNFHSRSEWLSLNQCAKSADILVNLLSAD